MWRHLSLHHSTPIFVRHGISDPCASIRVVPPKHELTWTHCWEAIAQDPDGKPTPTSGGSKMAIHLLVCSLSSIKPFALACLVRCLSDIEPLARVCWGGGALALHHQALCKTACMHMFAMTPGTQSSLRHAHSSSLLLVKSIARVNSIVQANQVRWSN